MATTTTTLSLWGLADDERDGQLGRLGLADAGVRTTTVRRDDGSVLLKLHAHDGGSLAWADAVVRARLGDAVVGDGERTLEEAVVDLLADQDLCAATAESLTAGLIASRLSDPPGASDVFVGGVVSYASRIKYEVLGVPEGPVVTAEAAAAMAEGACRVLGTNCAVAVTGVAGPAEMEGQPVGTVFVGSCVDGRSRGVFTPLSGDREAIRHGAASAALNELRLRLLQRARGEHPADVPEPSPDASVVIDVHDPVPTTGTPARAGSSC